MGSEQIFSPLLVKANAGTGKTFQLSNRFIALLVAGEEPDRILATTFTKKAAGEIRERVIQRLTKAALSDKAAEELSDDVKLKLNQAKAQELLSQLVAKQHRLNITTLDGFFHKMASAFALELGLSSAWNLAEPEQEYEFILKVVDKLCAAEKENLTEIVEILQAFSDTTRVFSSIKASIPYIYELFRQTPKEAWENLGDFKLLSSDEIERVCQNLQDNVILPKLKTNPNKEDSRWRKAVNDSIKYFKDEKWIDFISSGILAKYFSNDMFFYRVEIPSEIVDAYKPLIAHVRAMVLRQIMAKNRSTLELLERYHVEYCKLRKLSNAFSFDDIKFYLQHNEADLETIYYRLDTKIRHILLDEFQDTSFSQWKILKPIAAEILSYSNNERSFFCVGDKKQAIYAWRGGLSAIFDSLEKTWSQLKLEKMNESFRCGQPVLDCVNQTFSNLLEYFKLEHSDYIPAVKSWLGKDGFPEHSSAVKKQEGFASLQEVNGENLETSVVELTRQILARCPDFKIGILTRKNETIGQLVQQFIKTSGAPIVSEEGGSALIDSVVVRAILALLHLLDHPCDKLAAYHIATSPLGMILNFDDWRDLNKISSLCFAARLQISQKGLGQYFTELANKLRPFIDIREMQRLGQLIEYSFLETDWSTTRFDTFVDKVGAKRVLDASESNVRVMTIHASKGLEFDAVILPELAEPIFGHASTVLSRHQNVAESAVSMARYFSKKYTVLDENLKKMHQEDAMVKLQDALSVLYVAMTRAKSELYMLIPHDEKQGKKLTYANILKNTLVPVEKQELNGDFKNISELYSCGMPIKSMCISSKTEENNHLSDNYLFLKKDTVQARKYPKLEVVRPSDLEGEGVVSLNNIFNQHALHLGSLLHSLMENVMWLEDGLPDKNSWRKSLTADFSESEIEEAWSLFIQAIEHPEINVHLRRAFYQHDPQVWCEQRFSMLDNQHKILLGTFDRLVKWSGTKAEVIDFKTDFIKDNSSLNAKVEYYRQQLLAYRYAAAKFLALNEEDVSLTLMFIRTGDVVNVSDN